MKPVRLDFLVKYFAFDIYWSYFNERAPSLSVVCFIFWCRCAFVFRIKTKWGGGGANWLRLGGGDDDGGLDLNKVPLKTNTPFPRESTKESPSTQGTCMFFLSLFQVACVTLLFPFLFVFHNPLTLCHFSEFSSPGTSREASVTAKKGRPAPGGRW